MYWERKLSADSLLCNLRGSCVCVCIRVCVCVCVTADCTQPRKRWVSGVLITELTNDFNVEYGQSSSLVLWASTVQYRVSMHPSRGYLDVLTWHINNVLSAIIDWICRTFLNRRPVMANTVSSGGALWYKPATGLEQAILLVKGECPLGVTRTNWQALGSWRQVYVYQDCVCLCLCVIYKYPTILLVLSYDVLCLFCPYKLSSSLPVLSLQTVF